MTVEEIREALAADEMSGIARWHMVKTLLAEVDSLRARLAVADAALAAAREELANFKSVQVEMVPGIHGEGEESNATPSGIKATIDYLQKEWDGAEKRLNESAMKVQELEAVLRDIADNGSAGACVKAQRALHPATKEGK